MQESPKFLIQKSRDREAVRVLEHVCDMNGRECGLSIAMFEMLEREHNSDSTASRPTVKVIDRNTLMEKIQSEMSRLSTAFATNGTTR